MYFTGHAAIGYLVAAGPHLARKRVLDVKGALLPAMLGSFTPDIIDKPLYHFELLDHSRTIAHSIFFLLLAYLGWRFLKRRRSPHATTYGWWLAGVFSHLATDLVNDIHRGLEFGGELLFRAWIGWPVTDGSMARIALEAGPPCTRCHTTLEIATFALAVAVGIAAHLKLKRDRLS